MHHFTSLKIQCISLKRRVLEGKYPWNWFTNTWQFSVIFPPTSNHLHTLQVENCDSNSRLVVDEDDNGKVRPERVKGMIKLEQIQRPASKFTLNDYFSPNVNNYLSCLCASVEK